MIAAAGRLLRPIALGALLLLGQGGAAIAQAASPAPPSSTAGAALSATPAVISTSIKPGGQGTSDLTLHAGQGLDISITVEGLGQSADDGSFSYLPAAQDVSPYDNGEHTGDVSAAMLADLGCRYVEVGHSERRREHAETPALIGSKVRAVLRAGMDVILCTGELERAPVQAAIGLVSADLDAVLADLSADELGRVVVAYEPAWAIGSGHRPADPQRVGRVHRAIAALLGSGRGPVRPRVVYGGSVDAASAPRLLAEPGVDGLFVGRNALDPRAFALIAGAQPRP